MKFDYHHYVPCLRWKQGEYQALLRLKDTTKSQMTPLIEIPEVGWDFENKIAAKTIDDHLEPFARRVKIKWKDRRCFVDLKIISPSERMLDGRHPVEFVFSNLRKEKCVGIPVTGLGRDKQYQQAIRQVVSKDENGVCLRVTLEQAAKSNIKKIIDDLLSNIGVTQKDNDFILDLGAPNFIPLEGFCKVVQTIAQQLPYIERWRTLTLLGTSFPVSMAEIKGRTEIIPRYEWKLYKKLTANFKKADFRLPTFGDYAIAHPNVLNLDMRLVKPSASIKYTTNDEWYIIKGPNVRDNGFEQYRGHCNGLMASPYYFGSNFSEGDLYISECANGTGSTGNLTAWRWVGTNHHLEKVILDISSFSASLSDL